MPSDSTLRLTSALKEIAKNRSKEMQRLALAKTFSPTGDLSQTLTLVKIVEELAQVHKGDTGYSPIKGLDYFTQEEIDQFLKEVTPVKGVDYRDGIDGKQGIRGEQGISGSDGADGIANLAEVKAEANKGIQKHEKAFDHTLIHDPKIVGTLEFDEATVQEGDILQRKGNKLVGIKLPSKVDMNGLRSWVSSQGVSNIKSYPVTANTQLDAMGIYIADATNGDITITLPSASGRENYWFEVIRIDSSSNTVTISPSGSETISGMSNYIVQQWSDIKLFAYNGNYLLRGAT